MSDLTGNLLGILKLKIDRKFCVAPMMNWTDRFCRFFLRLISKQSVLYSEMISCGAVIHGNRQKYLEKHQDETPVALQLGGCVPSELALACKLVRNFNYSEINLNCGCPSNRVQNGRFGAVMMMDAKSTADCVSAMLDAANIPITVKHRTGVDESDSYEFMRDFVGTIADKGCQTFLVHARKAWLSGLSPKENRTLPTLDYERVYRLKKDFPNLEIIINGGISSIGESLHHLEKTDGVMMGREAYTNPYILATVDRDIYQSNLEPKPRRKIVEEYLPFIEHELANGVKLHRLTRHILGLFHGMPMAKAFRRHISENAHKSDADISLITEALEKTETQLP